MINEQKRNQNLTVQSPENCEENMTKSDEMFEKCDLEKIIIDPKTLFQAVSGHKVCNNIIFISMKM